MKTTQDLEEHSTSYGSSTPLPMNVALGDPFQNSEKSPSPSTPPPVGDDSYSEDEPAYSTLNSPRSGAQPPHPANIPPPVPPMDDIKRDDFHDIDARNGSTVPEIALAPPGQAIPPPAPLLGALRDGHFSPARLLRDEEEEEELLGATRSMESAGAGRRGGPTAFSDEEYGSRAAASPRDLGEEEPGAARARTNYQSESEFSRGSEYPSSQEDNDVDNHSQSEAVSSPLKKFSQLVNNDWSPASNRSGEWQKKHTDDKPSPADLERHDAPEPEQRTLLQKARPTVKAELDGQRDDQVDIAIVSDGELEEWQEKRKLLADSDEEEPTTAAVTANPLDPRSPKVVEERPGTLSRSPPTNTKIDPQKSSSPFSKSSDQASEGAKKCADCWSTVQMILVGCTVGAIQLLLGVRHTCKYDAWHNFSTRADAKLLPWEQAWTSVDKGTKMFRVAVWGCLWYLVDWISTLVIVVSLLQTVSHHERVTATEVERIPSFVTGGLLMLLSLLWPSFWHDVYRKGKIHVSTVLGLSVLQDNALFLLGLEEHLRSREPLTFQSFCCLQWMLQGCGCKRAHKETECEEQEGDAELGAVGPAEALRSDTAEPHELEAGGVKMNESDTILQKFEDNLSVLNEWRETDMLISSYPCLVIQVYAMLWRRECTGWYGLALFISAVTFSYALTLRAMRTGSLVFGEGGVHRDRWARRVCFFLFALTDFLWRTLAYCLVVRAWGYSHLFTVGVYALLVVLEYGGAPRGGVSKLKFTNEARVVVRSLVTPFAGALNVALLERLEDWPQMLVLFWLRWGLNVVMCSVGIHRSNLLWLHHSDESRTVKVDNWEGPHHGAWIAITVLATVLMIPMLQVISYWVKTSARREIKREERQFPDEVPEQPMPVY